MNEHKSSYIAYLLSGSVARRQPPPLPAVLLLDIDNLLQPPERAESTEQGSTSVHKQPQYGARY